MITKELKEEKGKGYFFKPEDFACPVCGEDISSVIDLLFEYQDYQNGISQGVELSGTECPKCKAKLSAEVEELVIVVSIRLDEAYSLKEENI